MLFALHFREVQYALAGVWGFAPKKILVVLHLILEIFAVALHFREVQYVLAGVWGRSPQENFNDFTPNI